jgi:hypothetical protein
MGKVFLSWFSLIFTKISPYPTHYCLTWKSIKTVLCCQARAELDNKEVFFYFPGSPVTCHRLIIMLNQVS